MAQFSHPYMTAGKIIALTIWTSVGKVMSLLFNMLSRFLMVFLLHCNRFIILSHKKYIRNKHNVANQLYFNKNVATEVVFKEKNV